MLLRQLPRSLLVGLLCGLFLTLIEQVDLLPLLQSTEQLQLSTDQGVLRGKTHEHHNPTAQPLENRSERLLATLGINIVLVWGLAMLVQAAMAAHHLYSGKPRLTWQSGMIWGLAGFWIFFLAPSLQFPPQAPVHDLSVATSSDMVQADQWFWWLLVFSGAWGLVWLYYCRPALKRAGLLLLTAPHLILSVRATVIGNYQLHPADQRLLDSLHSQLLFSSAITNLVFWVLLGTLCAILLKPDLYRPPC